MLNWFRRWRERRRQMVVDRLAVESDAQRERQNEGAVGGLSGSGRRTPYDEGHTHDRRSE